MMVQAKNASEFRAIVQELTGKNSDLGRTYHDGNAFGGDDDGQVIDDHGISTDHGFIRTHPKPPGFTDHECSNMVQSSLEFNESSFWREVSKSLGFQFPFVRV
ncbi:hypothetical protein Vadar_003933 [Vaccinium darrowii]|uniref:Uncharacterized protein n=1 Tax=Vaccinium darrowii TaxID=229202 RepID=A0ACB7ZGT2_9ERIC|nr:hypothetical protein Vadar_003933 [Vaccinium darrowii]